MSAKPLAVNIPDACQVAGLGRTKIYEAIGTGALKARKADGRTIILLDELDEYLRNLPLAGKAVEPRQTTAAKKREA